MARACFLIGRHYEANYRSLVCLLANWVSLRQTDSALSASEPDAQTGTEMIIIGRIVMTARVGGPCTLHISPSLAPICTAIINGINMHRFIIKFIGTFELIRTRSISQTTAPLSSPPTTIRQTEDSFMTIIQQTAQPLVWLGTNQWQTGSGTRCKGKRAHCNLNQMFPRFLACNVGFFMTANSVVRKKRKIIEQFACLD